MCVCLCVCERGESQGPQGPLCPAAWPAPHTGSKTTSQRQATPANSAARSGSQKQRCYTQLQLPHLIRISIQLAAHRWRNFCICHSHSAHVGGGMRLHIGVCWARCAGLAAARRRALHTHKWRGQRAQLVVCDASCCSSRRAATASSLIAADAVPLLKQQESKLSRN